jgi:RNA polymerase sigma-70 factor, ECF subfamily
MSMNADDIVLHVPELRRYARQLTRDNTAADDLLQETLTRALNKLHLYDPSGSFKGWLCTIMKNLFLDDRRRRQKWPSCSFIEQEHGAARFCRPEQIDRLILKELRGAIQQLPEAQRAVLIGVVAHGWSYEQASERLGVAIGTVRSRLFRARSALLQMLDPPDATRGRRRGRPAVEAGVEVGVLEDFAEPDLAPLAP